MCEGSQHQTLRPQPSLWVDISTDKLPLGFQLVPGVGIYLMVSKDVHDGTSDTPKGGRASHTLRELWSMDNSRESAETALTDRMNTQKKT